MWQPAPVFDQSYQGNRQSWTRSSSFVTNGSHGLKKPGVLSGLEMGRKGQRIHNWHDRQGHPICPRIGSGRNGGRAVFGNIVACVSTRSDDRQSVREGMVVSRGSCGRSIDAAFAIFDAIGE